MLIAASPLSASSPTLDEHGDDVESDRPDEHPSRPIVQQIPQI